MDGHVNFTVFVYVPFNSISGLAFCGARKGPTFQTGVFGDWSANGDVPTLNPLL